MGSTIPDAPQLPEQAADAFALTEPAAKKRMLIIVNPYASTVSENLRHLVVHALQGRYEVDAVDTEARGHATELCREAAHEGYDVVVAFGGDGTVNEAANGLLGSPTPLTCLPGGSTNVFGKMLGIPGELIDATEHILGLADDWRPRKADLGVVNGRCFTFASGLGLDASVVQRVNSNPRLKARLGPWYFTGVAVTTFARRYLVRPPRLTALVGDEQLDGVTAIVQNSSPFTYFQNRPIEIAEDAGCKRHRDVAHPGHHVGGKLQRLIDCRRERGAVARRDVERNALPHGQSCSQRILVELVGGHRGQFDLAVAQRRDRQPDRVALERT